jgi:predicted metal-dependent hydrolase
MSDRIELGEIRADVIRKDIKHVHLSVLPPKGRVRIAAPRDMKVETIRLFAISRLAWIRAEQHKMQEQPRESPRSYLTRESHHVWGRRYLLQRVEHDAAPTIELSRSRLVLKVRPDTDSSRCGEILDGWYRNQLRLAVPALIQKWAPVLGVSVAQVFVQRMKTQWGSCNPLSHNIRLNTELAKKPPECLEYIVVHELAHLIEPSHNARFVALMDDLLPHWPHLKATLNRLPVRHEDWDY